jgi:putative ABC transport system permease protein
MFHIEALRSSVQALRANKFRAFLTALGLVIGNASVILVVTISLTSRDYVLDQIQAIGSNMVYAQFDGGNNPAMAVADADYIKVSDVQAVRDQLGSRIVAATGVMNNFDQMRIEGRDEDVSIIGADQYYPQVRNLALLAGRFVDAGDIESRNHVAMLTERLAKRLFRGQSQAVGQTIKIHGLQFDIIGTFKERTSSLGQSEITGENVMIPITVLKYFAPLERIDPLYVQAHSTADVDTRRALQSGESVGDPERRKEYRQDHDLGADPGQRDCSGNLRNRHHEHHAGDGDGTDPGNRAAHGSGRRAAQCARAVSG